MEKAGRLGGAGLVATVEVMMAPPEYRGYTGTRTLPLSQTGGGGGQQSYHYQVWSVSVSVYGVVWLMFGLRSFGCTKRF